MIIFLSEYVPYEPTRAVKSLPNRLAIYSNIFGRSSVIISVSISLNVLLGSLLRARINLSTLSVENRPYLRLYSVCHFHRAYGVLPYGMVVEPSPVRGLVADCPILELFKPLPSTHISSFCFGIKALRVFQQFNRFLLGERYVHPPQHEIHYRSVKRMC